MSRILDFRKKPSEDLIMFLQSRVVEISNCKVCEAVMRLIENDPQLTQKIWEEVK